MKKMLLGLLLITPAFLISCGKCAKCETTENTETFCEGEYSNQEIVEKEAECAFNNGTWTNSL